MLVDNVLLFVKQWICLVSSDARVEDIERKTKEYCCTRLVLLVNAMFYVFINYFIISFLKESATALWIFSLKFFKHFYARCEEKAASFPQFYKLLAEPEEGEAHRRRKHAKRR